MTAKPMTQEEKKELQGYLLEASEKHVEHDRPDIVPGFHTIYLNIDVRLLPWKKTLHEGLYFVQWPDDPIPEDGQLPESSSWLWTLAPDVEAMQELLDKAEDVGVLESADESVKAILSRVDVKEDRPLLYADMLIWAAVGDAVEANETDRVYRLFSLAYGKDFGVDSDSEDDGDREYSRRKRTNVSTHHLDILTDPLTNAMTDKISPADYFSPDPVQVDTGNGGHALLNVKAGDGTEIDAAYRDYKITDRTRFWLDPLYTLAFQGYTEVTGSDLLKLNGYPNPYAEGAREAMADACRHVLMATAVRVQIDLTNEKRNKRRHNARIVSSTRWKSVVAADIDVDNLVTDDGEEVRDFTVRLLCPKDDPGEALPLAEYAHNRGMLTSVSEDDLTFTGLRVTTAQRQMWRYILRRIQSRKLSGKILFSTMFDALDMEEPDVSEYAEPKKVEDALRRLADEEAVYDSMAKAGASEEALAIRGEELEKVRAEVESLKSERASDKVISQRRERAVRKQRERMIAALEKMLDQKQGTLFSRWAYTKDSDGKVDGIRITRKPKPKSEDQDS